MWKKLGRIYEVNNENEYLLSHASNPLAIHLEKDVFRIYYSGRNKDQKSSVSSFDFDLEKMEVVNDPKTPHFTFGSADTYNSHGVSIGCLAEMDEKQFLFYMAWQIRGENHWRGDIGRLALTGDGGLNDIDGRPFLEIDQKVDEVSLSYPWIIRENNLYKMWYGSTIDWSSENGEMIHVINYATSENGREWDRHGLAIPYDLGVAQAFSRPVVVKKSDGYHMWFSYRSGDGTKYRIGYAFSSDGEQWERLLDQSGITVSEEGWDSEMVCYPFVFEHNGKQYLLYNGNGHGKSGIGLAVYNES